MNIESESNLKTKAGLNKEIKECLETAKTIYSIEGFLSPVCFILLKEHETPEHGKHVDRVLFPLSYDGYDGYLSTLTAKDTTDEDREMAKKLFEVIGINPEEYKNYKPSDWLYVAGRMASFTKMDVGGVMMVAEAWFSKIKHSDIETREQAKKISLMPSEDPNRKEAIVCAILNTEGVGEVDGLQITKAGKGGEFAPLFPSDKTKNPAECEDGEVKTELNSLQAFYRGYWGLK